MKRLLIIFRCNVTGQEGTFKVKSFVEELSTLLNVSSDTSIYVWVSEKEVALIPRGLLHSFTLETYQEVEVAAPSTAQVISFLRVIKATVVRRKGHTDTVALDLDVQGERLHGVETTWASIDLPVGTGVDWVRVNLNLEPEVVGDRDQKEVGKILDSFGGGDYPSANPQRKDGTVRLNLRFTECEHSGDKGNYRDDIVKCGGSIVDDGHNYDAETCYFKVDVADKDAFVKAFEQTPSFGFSNLAD